MIINKAEQINYEDLLENIINEIFYEMYGIVEEKTVWEIFFLRFMIIKDLKKIKIKEHINDVIYYLLQELNLPVIDNTYIVYKEIYFNIWYGISNSLRNIIEQKFFRYYELSSKKKIETVFKKVYIPKNKLLSLKNLNILYGIDYVKRVNLRKYDFKFPPWYNELELTIDEKLERQINNNRHNREQILEEKIFSSQTKYIKEVKRYLARQYKLTEDCIVDILAEGYDGEKIIIELKVSHKPKDLLYQILRYKQEGTKKFGQVKIVVVVPENTEKELIEIAKQVLPDVIIYTEEEILKNL